MNFPLLQKVKLSLSTLVIQILSTKATRAITNHAPIEEYCLCFFPKEPFKCSCDAYLIESRNHVHHCKRCNKY